MCIYVHTHTHKNFRPRNYLCNFLNKYTGSPLKNKYVSKFEHIKNWDIFIMSLIIQTGFDIKWFHKYLLNTTRFQAPCNTARNTERKVIPRPSAVRWKRTGWEHKTYGKNSEWKPYSAFLLLCIKSLSLVVINYH